MGNLGFQEILLILVVLFVVFLVILGIFLILRYGVSNKSLHHRITELEKKIHDRDSNQQY
ncbi:MAG: hypothetical protein JWN76_113 [Chitinophagaceae bacterium]|nr:hypothetical protein [Chitinophagaceae bacterium]